MCTSSDSSEGHLGSFQIWGLLKYVKRSLCLLGHTGRGNLTSGSPQWERAGGTAWHMHWALMLLDLCHQPHGVVAHGRCGAQQRPFGSALLKGYLFGQGVLLLLCLMWQRDSFHFYTFLFDILYRLEMCSWFLYEKGKKYTEQLVIHTGWSNKEVSLSSTLVNELQNLEN